MGDFIEKASDILGMPIETVNKAVSFLGKLVAPTLEELSLIPYDYVKAFRYKRNIDILCRTQEYCLEKNIKIKKIEYIKENNTVYNFEVANNHTYFVSENNILVHNAKIC